MHFHWKLSQNHELRICFKIRGRIRDSETISYKNAYFFFFLSKILRFPKKNAKIPRQSSQNSKVQAPSCERRLTQLPIKILEFFQRLLNVFFIVFIVF